MTLLEAHEALLEALRVALAKIVNAAWFATFGYEDHLKAEAELTIAKAQRQFRREQTSAEVTVNRYEEAAWQRKIRRGNVRPDAVRMKTT